MTTYQEPQPVSRRAARQHERGESLDAVQTEVLLPGQFVLPPLVEPGESAYPTPNDNLWDTLSRRAAQLPLTTPEPSGTAPETHASPPPQGGRRAANQQVAPADQPAPTVYAEQQATAHRTRDFSPESRRSLRESAEVQSIPKVPRVLQPAPPQQFSQFAPESRTAHAPASQIPSEAQNGMIEHTLSRRELRALENAQQTPVPEAMWPESYSPTTPDHAPEQYFPTTPDRAPQYAPEQYFPATPEHAPEQARNESVPWTAPVGHWSNQLSADDDRFGDLESTINRTVGGTSASTSALVLPAIPTGSDIRGALTHTGEVILTGSINLPLSLSSTGTSSRIDQGGIDDLFDWRDEELVSVDSQPVRAMTAVSTSIGGHGVTHTHKPKGTRGLTALLVTACALAVVVTGLIIAAFALNLL